jgi:hypothetical protein
MTREGVFFGAAIGGKEGHPPFLTSVENTDTLKAETMAQ